MLELQCLGDVPVFCEGGIVLTSRVILGALREEVKVDLLKLLHVYFVFRIPPNLYLTDFPDPNPDPYSSDYGSGF